MCGTFCFNCSMSKSQFEQRRFEEKFFVSIYVTTIYIIFIDPVINWYGLELKKKIFLDAPVPNKLF